MVETNSLTVPEWLVELKQARVFPFTRSEDFFYELHEVFDLIQEQVQEDRKRYSQDWASVGLPGLVNGCLRKASRLFDLFVQDMPGKDKPEDELRDNMMVGIYAYLYYKMLVEGPRKDRESLFIEKESPPKYGSKGSQESSSTIEEVETANSAETETVEDLETEDSSGESSTVEELDQSPKGRSFLGSSVESPENNENLETPEEEENTKPTLGYL